MSYINYKDVRVMYNDVEVNCTDFKIINSDFLEDVKNRGTNKNGIIYRTQRPVTRIDLNYLIGVSGDPFYEDFEGLFDGTTNISQFESQILSIGSTEFTGLYPESLSVSASENSFFNANVILVAYSNITGQFEVEDPSDASFENDILIGHSANSPLAGVSGASSVNLNISLQQNPIYFLGNSGSAPDFIDIKSRRKECSIDVTGINSFVASSGFSEIDASFDVNSLNGEQLQTYSMSGKLQSNDISLNAGGDSSINISIINFV